MPVWLRIGPWAHGECRNGGFPDWLLKKGIALRTDDPVYLGYVQKFWQQLSHQAKGMMCKDGGPILGIQLENEYGHCGGPLLQEEGLAHLKTLKEMAKTLGFVVPYYTATAWGGAYVLQNETLPVYGGYVDAPWAQHTHEMPASENFLFIPFHNDATIGSDLKHPKEGEAQEVTRGPYLTAELGGGLQVTAHRRTYPYPADIEAQSLCMLGSGANLLGYYMYHGGFNPEGHVTTLQESKETGYANDLPIKSYDFQTCIKESGQLNESYHRVKKWHLFLQDFGSLLAPAKVYLPDQKPSSPEDLTTLRASVRHHESGQGFLFINNHQRKRNLPAHQACTFTLQFDESELVLGPIDVLQEACMLIPYQLQMGKAKLLRTNASLLCRLGKRYFFYTDQLPYYELEKEEEEKGLSLITLSVGEANRAYKLGQRLYIADCPLIEKEGKIYALSTKQTQKIVYYEEHGEAKTCTLSFEWPHLEVVVHEKQAFEESDEAAINTQKIRRYLIAFQNDFPPEAKDVFLDIAYKGDRAEVYQQGKLIADWYTTGAPWHLALKRYEYPRQIELVIYPSKGGVYFDLPVTQGCELEGITAFCEQMQEVTR
jgi:hypothetical protein